ncbi:SMI1/KNR4 family protein [Streptomyces niveiscabiei]|uniref:SMI1/KNR4 family protein n=1 Tax=Streptomyces TaxID=1883 RepID=UPI0006EB5C05|nr:MULTISPECIES: SMI1/KNR4 family protein [Streptomyces]QZZ32636.1 SMI1/KNR4 family protein [Streptomyces sp. ST1015]
METEKADPEDLAMLREAFGADASPLGWEEVRRFEEAHGVVLPEPFRTLVAEIADGSFQGPPEYGWVGLAESAEGQRLAVPFPLTEMWVWEEDPDAVVEGIEGVVHHGSLNLGTDGCGMDWHLVVTGPQRGRVWLITGEGAMPHSRPGFIDWVRQWVAGEEWFQESEAVQESEATS